MFKDIFAFEGFTTVKLSTFWAVYCANNSQFQGSPARFAFVRFVAKVDKKQEIVKSFVINMVGTLTSTVTVSVLKLGKN